MPPFEHFVWREIEQKTCFILYVITCKVHKVYFVILQKKYLTLGTLAKGVITHLGVDFVLDFAESDF